MTKDELTKILELHEKWLNSEEGGECADLSNVDLSNANLRCANLSYANLSYAYLSCADLINANLRGANLSYAYLSYADLINANLRGANLSNVDLSYANLSYANLSNANLSYANLSNAYLSCADLINVNLRGANLSNANLDEKEQCRKGTILKEPLIGYKKLKNDVIATLEIPKGAIVFSINNSKCRTNKAKCIALSDNAKIGYSNRDCDFTYEINKKYEIEDFDLMYNIECASGIHFFKTLKEADDYK